MNTSNYFAIEEDMTVAYREKRCYGWDLHVRVYSAGYHWTKWGRKNDMIKAI